MNSKDDAQRQTESWLLLSYKFLSFKWELEQIISEKQITEFNIILNLLLYETLSININFRRTYFFHSKISLQFLG